jgi:hypothetical protein
LAAAAEAALAKPRANAKAKATTSVEDVTAMAEAKFGKRRGPILTKTQLKDTIRRVPVAAPKARGRPKGSRNRKTLERASAVAAIAVA